MLGCVLERELGGKRICVKIVETEAYDQTDAASHSYKGQTPRTAVLFGPPGHVYIYFTYGMHYCCNVVVGHTGGGAAVLIRAVEPLHGEDVLLRYRKGKKGVELTNGPAKLCQALSIDKTLNGHNLSVLPLRLLLQPALPDKMIQVSSRIGITQAKEVLWRFYLRDNKYVSRFYCIKSHV